jgi:hypothetical protein
LSLVAKCKKPLVLKGKSGDNTFESGCRPCRQGREAAACAPHTDEKLFPIHSTAGQGANANWKYFFKVAGPSGPIKQYGQFGGASLFQLIGKNIPATEPLSLMQPSARAFKAK